MTEYTFTKPEGLLAHYTSASVVFEHILPTGRLRLSPYRLMRDPVENKDILPSIAWWGDPPDADRAIQEVYAQLMRSSGLLGISAVAPGSFVFQTRTGRPQSRRNVLRAWQDALAEIGIDGCGLHTLRHSFISRLEERGVSVAIAAELVGHSRVTTTQAVYTRMRGGRDAKLAAQREALRIASS